ncbi:hypothetical protein H9L19_06255 [Weissella diestrammenae]|uniref:Uncharacterized protein n=1 Tax=Weissella diestrammenae TaxID=1162633 RepID=A0A7G9T4G3_9LACO|nr:hypothetical protein [Weissella diestrammenae]MCM0583524.1 hypothetical protein [Weissella diestrammenae]QNN74988.1 hypothetical protein H9L19_06255 [Weissella diestrammenae]
MYKKTSDLMDRGYQLMNRFDVRAIMGWSDYRYYKETSKSEWLRNCVNQNPDGFPEWRRSDVERFYRLNKY